MSYIPPAEHSTEFIEEHRRQQRRLMQQEQHQQQQDPRNPQQQQHEQQDFVKLENIDESLYIEGGRAAPSQANGIAPLYRHPRPERDIILCCPYCTKQTLSVDEFSDHLLSGPCIQIAGDIIDCPGMGCAHQVRVIKGQKKAALSNLCNHIRAKHARDTSFVCPWCTKGFASKVSLKYHTKQHEDPTKFYCSQCEHFYHNEKYFKHQERHSRSAGTQVECPSCTKIFDSMARLKQHAVIHSGEYKYQCEMCNHKFHQKKNLEVHRERKHFKMQNFSPSLL